MRAQSGLSLCTQLIPVKSLSNTELCFVARPNTLKLGYKMFIFLWLLIWSLTYTSAKNEAFQIGLTAFQL
uniref:Uncharacterized protein n=1 Tax=Anguilla anguilla TaxID=7936 RepID=A0A0E9X210_ANGAN